MVCYRQRNVPLPKTLGNPHANRRRLVSGREETHEDNSTRNRRTSVSDQNTSTSHLSQREGLVLSQYLEASSLTMEELDSTHLDSKLAEIKREREEVMLKLKAIQSMREAIESGSCNSESEQELDSKQSGKSPKGMEGMTAQSPTSKVGRSEDDGQDISGMNSASGSKNTVCKNFDQSSNSGALEMGDRNGSKSCPDKDQRWSSLDAEGDQRRGENQRGRRRSQEFYRPEMSGPSHGWGDPYHWNAPHHSDGMMEYDNEQHMDYYNEDDQSDMFDLDEMFYAAQSKLAVKRVSPSKLKAAAPPPENPGRFSEDVVKMKQSNTNVEDMEIDESSQPAVQESNDPSSSALLGESLDTVSSQGFDKMFSNRSVKNEETGGTIMDIDRQNIDNLESSNVETSETMKSVGAASELKTSHINDVPFNPMDHLQPPGADMNISPHYGTPEFKNNSLYPLSTSPSKSITLSSGLCQSSHNSMLACIQPPGTNMGVYHNNDTRFLQDTTSSNALMTSPSKPMAYLGFNQSSHNSMQGIQPPGTNMAVYHNYDTTKPRGTEFDALGTSPLKPIPSLGSGQSFYNPVQGIQPPGTNLDDVYHNYGTPETKFTASPHAPSPDDNNSSYKPINDLRPPGTNNDIDIPTSTTQEFRSNYSSSVHQNYGSHTQDYEDNHHFKMYKPQPTGTSTNNIDCQRYASSEFQDKYPDQAKSEPSISTTYNSIVDNDAQQRNISIVCQSYGSPESSSSPSRGPTPDLMVPKENDSGTLMDAPDVNAPPSSDFQSSQVISFGTDGRLRLATTTAPASNPSPVYQDTTATVVTQIPHSPHQFHNNDDDLQRCLSPTSGYEDFIEAKMSPPPPVMPHFEYESNMIAVEQSDTPLVSDANTTRPSSGNSAMPVSTAMISSDRSKLSEGTMSAVLALQKEMDQTSDPIQRCALRVAMNTLLSKPPVNVTKSKDKLMTLPDAATPKPQPKKIKTFYGYPLIKKAKKSPRVIPLDKDPGINPQPFDPRLHSSLTQKTRQEVSLSVLPWGKCDPDIPEGTNIVSPECNNKNDPVQIIRSSQSTSNKPNLRDPRIRKQILKAQHELSDKSLNRPNQSEPVDDDIICLGTHRGVRADTPESGELTDSPVYQDTRTVVVIRGDQSRRGNPKRGQDTKQVKMMDKLKYVQDVSASRPKSVTDRKVVVHKLDVFDRLGNKKVEESVSKEEKQHFDLRNRIKGKKMPPLTGYNIRDAFLHSESSNDSSVMELKTPLLAEEKEEKYTDSFKWFNREISEQKDKSSYELQIDEYTQARDDLRQKLSRNNERDWSRDKYGSRETSVDRQSIERDTQRSDRDRDCRSRTPRESYYQRDRDGYNRDKYSQDNSNSKHRERSLSIDGSGHRSLLVERSLKRSLSTDGSSQQSWSMEGSSQQSWSMEGSSQGSVSYERMSSQRSASHRSSLSPVSQEIGHSIYSRRHPNQNTGFDNMGNARKGSISRSSSVSSCGKGQDSLGDRLEKEHGIPLVKKRKCSESKMDKNKALHSANSNPSYRDLSHSLSALKQSVNDGIRSYKELNKSELHSRIGRFKDRYKHLQDLSIRALECHYQQDRIPSDLDTTIQQRLLEIITDIELQQESLDKYKPTVSPSGSFKEDYARRGSAPRGRDHQTMRGGSGDGRQHKYATNSPARSTSGKLGLFCTKLACPFMVRIFPQVKYFIPS